MSQPISKRLRVAVLCGGISAEREVSLKSGTQVMKHLDPKKYDPVLVEIATDGQWFLSTDQSPLQIDIAKPVEKQMAVHPGLNDLSPSGDRPFDIAFIALHGSFGEDGHIQALLDLLHIPYTGSGVLASALCMHKWQTRRIVAALGIVVPRSFVLTHETAIDLDIVHERIVREVGYPCVIKPNQSGSSIGITLVKSRDQLGKALEKGFQDDVMILVDEYVHGRELTCGALGNSSIGGRMTVLPPVEIIPAAEFFDYEAKYQSTETREICPALLEEKQTQEIQRLTEMVHRELGCDGLTRSDFLLRDDVFYYLETNTIPGLTEHSLCPKEAEAMGMHFGEFLDKQIQLALKKYASNA